MTKAASAAFVTELGKAEHHLAWCWKVVPSSPLSSLSFTSADIDLSVDISDGEGATTYLSATGFLRDAVSHSDQLNVDSAQHSGFLDSNGIKEGDLIDGYYDAATVYLFLVNWDDLTDGIIKMRKGTLGEISHGDITFEAELLGLLLRLQQDIGNFYTEMCRVITFGDTICQVQVDPPVWAASIAYAINADGVGDKVVPSVHNGRFFVVTTAGTSGATEPVWTQVIGNTVVDGSVVWTVEDALYKEGTVASVTSNQVFTMTGFITPKPPDTNWSVGRVEFLSGANNGKTMDVDSWVGATDTVTLSQPMPRTVAVGASVRFHAGCDRSKSHCFDIYDNLINMQAELHMPNDKEVFAFVRPN